MGYILACGVGWLLLAALGNYLARVVVPPLIYALPYAVCFLLPAAIILFAVYSAIIGEPASESPLPRAFEQLALGSVGAALLARAIVAFRRHSKVFPVWRDIWD